MFSPVDLMLVTVGKVCMVDKHNVEFFLNCFTFLGSSLFSSSSKSPALS